MQRSHRPGDGERFLPTTLCVVSAKSTRPPQTSREPAAGPRPWSVTTAAVVAALQGAVLVGWGLYMIVEGLVGDPDSPMQAELGGLTVLAMAALPLFAARGLLGLRRWGRGPVLIIQILALPVAWSMVQNGGGMIAAGAALGVSALVGLAALVHPATTKALQPRS